MATPRVERSFDEPHLRLTCGCGWEGHDDDVESWDVQRARDRVVRRCPSCGEPVPEWGTLGPIDGVALIARGPLRDALIESDESGE